MKQWWTARELAGLPGMPDSDDGVHIRGKAEGWASNDVKSRGRKGFRREYHLDSLPVEVQKHLRAQCEQQELERLIEGKPHIEAGARAGLEHRRERVRLEEDALQRREDALTRFSRLPESHRRIAEARADLLDLAQGYLKSAGGLSVGGAWSKRVVLLFLRHLPELAGRLKSPVAQALARREPRLSYPTLLSWRDKRAEAGVFALAPGWKAHNAGDTTVPQAVQQWLLSMLYQHPGMPVTGREGMAELGKARFGAAMPHEASVRRWVKKWLKQNASLYLRMTNPDEWKRKYRFSIGDADADVVRLNQVWELDSSPADVLCTDGRYTLLACIDVWSRRAGLLVVPTSNSAGIAALVRQCLLAWGVPEAVRQDNGKDYASKHLERVYENLGIELFVCPPFHPEKKPFVEAFFKTVARHLEHVPGFIGHSVADRKAIEGRRAFSERQEGAPAFRFQLTSEELQAHLNQWREHVYEQNVHDDLGCLTPHARARSYTGDVRRIASESALDVILAPAVTRTVTARGVTWDHGHFFAPELRRVSGQEVLVQPDPADRSHVQVSAWDDEAGEYAFLCWAIDPARVPGVAVAEFAGKVKAYQEKEVSQQLAEIKKIARELAPQEVHREYLDYRRAQTANLVELPSLARDVAYTTPALEQAQIAADTRDGSWHPDLERWTREFEAEEKRNAEEAAAAALAAEREAARRAAPVVDLFPAEDEEPNPSHMDDADRYAYWKELDRKQAQGQALSESAAVFYTAFGHSPAFLGFREMEADLSLEG